MPVFTLQSGWAFRFRLLPDGRRQILTFYLPGDLIGIHVLADLPAAISGVRTVTESWVCVFDRAEIRAALIEFPDARTKFEAMRKERILMTDELVIDLGRRSAEERIVRLILEFYARLQARRAVKDDSFEFPIRQEHLADALGLTVVHVSRTLGSLRAQKLISFTRNRMTIIDLPRITALGALDKAFTDYLLSPDAA